jgi:hypothetical protein
LAHPDIDETNFETLRSIKAAHPNLHLLLSVGGAPPSTFFSKIASSEGLRVKFAESCIDLALKNGFDGLDIDWEYPVNDGIPGSAIHSEDRYNFVSLLKTTRDVLDRRMGRKHGLLTAATTAYWNHLPDLALSEIARYLDWFNVMSWLWPAGSPCSHSRTSRLTFSDAVTRKVSRVEAKEARRASASRPSTGSLPLRSWGRTPAGRWGATACPFS